MKTDRRSLPYGVYLLSMLIFGTNGLLVPFISGGSLIDAKLVHSGAEVSDWAKGL